MIDDFLAEAKRAGFVLIGRSSDAAKTSVALLMRKVGQPLCQLDKQTVIEVKNYECEWVDKVKQAMAAVPGKEEGENIWLVAQDMPTNGIVGMINCLRFESGGQRVRSVFNKTGQRELLDKHMKDLVAKNMVSNVLVSADIESGRGVGTYRHLAFNVANNNEDLMIEVNDAYLNVVTRGDLTSLRWFDLQNKFWEELPKEMRLANQKRCSAG